MRFSLNTKQSLAGLPAFLFLTTAPDGSPLIKVLDFGIAKNVARDPALGTLTMTLVALGTPLYIAPEQIRSSRTVDARADVWSLGAILYQLLTGKAVGEAFRKGRADPLRAGRGRHHQRREISPCRADATVETYRFADRLLALAFAA